MRNKIIIFAFILLTSKVDAQPGTLDLTFGGSGYVITKLSNGTDMGYDIAIQNDQKIVVVGTSDGDGRDFSIVRYNTNGTLDSSFGTDGKIITPVVPSYNDIAFAIVIQNDGKIVVAGESSDGSVYDISIIRYNINGTLDTSFGIGGKVTYDLNNTNDKVRSLALQSDGKIIVTGYAFANTIPDVGIIRCNTDGSIDSAFGTNGRIITHIGSPTTRTQAESVIVQPDGKIIIVANPAIANCDFALLRYNCNGSLDSTYGNNGVAFINIANSYSYYAYDAVLQNDGKIVVSGHISGSQNGYFAARFNTNGSLDILFGTSGVVITNFALAAHGYGIALDHNEKIIVVGGSTYQAPNSGFALARYNTNGTLDSAFGENGTVSTIFENGNCSKKAAIQNDNKIVVAGYANDRNLGRVFAVARYNSQAVEIHDFILDDLFNIYPNPVYGKITITKSSDLKNASLCIYSIQGQLILQQLLLLEKSEIDVSSLAKGIYIIKINDRNLSFTKKIIIE